MTSASGPGTTSRSTAAALDEADPAEGPGRIVTSAAPARTVSPSRVPAATATTVPSTGAVTSCSIFMDSITTRHCPART
jgi:hypothetical protein